MDIDKIKELISEYDIILFLGQDIEEVNTIFLNAVSKKYLNYFSQNLDYSIVLKLLEDGLEPKMAWMTQLALKIAPPVWLETINNLQLSHVMTSNIVDIYERGLQNEWRKIVPIYDDRSNVINPRNKLNLHLTYLYGCVNQDIVEKSPPLSRLKKIKRDSIANNLLQRLPTLISPRGKLIIDFYDPKNDWVTLEQLYPIIDKLDLGQVMWFNYGLINRINDPVVDELKSSGKIIFFEKHFHEYLSELQHIHNFNLEIPAIESQYGRWIRLGKRKFQVPQDIYLRIIRSAKIIEDSVFMLSNDERGNENILLSDFLSSSYTMPHWPGYKNGCAFEREFVKKAIDKIDKLILEKSKNYDKPLIIYGQSSAGKTIGLGYIAHKLVLKYDFPILYIERRYRRPEVTDVEMFLRWTEQFEPLSIIIWDGNLEDSFYLDFQRALIAAGRRVILIGSQYKYNDEISLEKYKGTYYIEAPIELSNQETSAFYQYIEEHKIDRAPIERFIKERSTKNLLALLYRFLPETKASIRTGLSTELSKFSKLILEKAIKDTQDVKISDFAEILVKSGLISKEEIITSKLETTIIDGESLSIHDILAYLILVPGQYGIMVPVDLVLRTIGMELDSISILKELSKYDIFQWMDKDGNYYLSPRNSYEASIIVLNTGSIKTQVDCMTRLLREVKYSANWLQNDEVDFAVSLLNKIGPNSPNRLKNEFLEIIIETLADIRLINGFSHPRLALQEVSFIRELVKDGFIEKNLQKTRLNESEALAREMLDQFHKRKESYLYKAFRTELASIIGTHLVLLINETPLNKEEINVLYNEIKEIVKNAKIEPENYNLFDVFFWSTRFYLSTGYLTFEDIQEIKVDLMSLFELYSTIDLEYKDRIKINQRKYEFGQLFDMQNMSDQALETLEKSGSVAGYYIIADRILKLRGKTVQINGNITPEEKILCNKAYLYLSGNESKILSDSRVLYFYFKLWWIQNTGYPIFSKKAQKVGFTSEKWAKVIYFMDILLNLGSSIEETILYIKGVALIHLYQFNESKELFKSLKEETELSGAIGRRRIEVGFVMCDSNGLPLEFDGLVEYEANIRNNQRFSSLFIPNLRIKTTFYLAEFGLQRIGKGEKLSKVWLGINYLGFVAVKKENNKG